MASRRSRLHILLVDDDPDWLSSYQAALAETLDAEVTTASCSEIAYAKLKARDIQCVISDYNMPGEDGLSFLDRLRGDYPGTMRILVSAYLPLADARKAIQDGIAHSFVAKARARRELVAKIEKLVAEVREV